MRVGDISELLYYLLPSTGSEGSIIHSHIWTGLFSVDQHNPQTPLIDKIRYSRLIIRKHSHKILVWGIFQFQKQGTNTGHRSQTHIPLYKVALLLA